MNVFNLIMLAFVFYLAQKGRLVGYIQLATQTNQTAVQQAQGANTPTQNMANAASDFGSAFLSKGWDELINTF